MVPEQPIEDIYDVSYSKKFQSFLVAGWTRFLTSRFFSLVYMIIFYRLVADEPRILANMIILSSGNILFSVGMTFGLNYSAKQKTLESERFNAEIFASTSRFLLFISAPITFFLSIIYGLLILSSGSSLSFGISYFELLGETFIEYQSELLLYGFFNSLSVIYIFLQSLEEAMLNINKAYALIAGYSILNSILVPLFYFLDGSLLSIILAWNVAMVFTICIVMKDLKNILLHKGSSFSHFKDVLLFGFPSFLVIGLKTIGNELDKLLIFGLINPLELPSYYINRRILTFGLEFTLLFFSGLNVIFVRLKTENFKRFCEVVNSSLRLVPLFISLVFTFIVINSHTLGDILVGESYNVGGILLVFIAFNFIVWRSTESFISMMNTLGLPKKALQGEIFRLVIRICFVLLFVPFGVIGVVISLIITELITGIVMLFVFKKYVEVPGKDYLNTIIYIALLLVIMITSLLIPVELIYQLLFTIFFVIISFIGFNIIKPLKNSEIRLLDHIVPKKVMKIFYLTTSYEKSAT